MSLFAGIWGLAAYIEAGEPKYPALSESLKEYTKDIHAQVTNHTFMQQLMNGTIAEKHYQQYLFDLHAVYEALELELGVNGNNPHIKPLCFEGLFRAQAIQNDLTCFPSKPLELSTAAKEYVTHLSFLGRQNPTALIGHMDARYLGDLSGGMIIKPSVAARWSQAIQYYDFSDLLKSYENSPDRFKQVFKDRMDQLALTDQQQEAILAEAYLAFTYAIRMLDEIPRVSGSE